MSIRHIFGFDHIPVGVMDLPSYFDTRIVPYVSTGTTIGASVIAGGWLGAGGGSTYQGWGFPVYNDTPNHAVFGFRARAATASAYATTQTPLSLVVGGQDLKFHTKAELDASQVYTSAGDYFTFDFNFVSGVVRRWIGKLELPTMTFTPAQLKAAQYVFCVQAYNSTYQSFQYRDIYIGDDFDGKDVQALGDRVVRSQPVKTAVGANWVASDGGSLVTALNKAWVTGAADVSALNQTDNSAIRVKFDPGQITPDVDAVQLECAASVGGPTTGIKVAREGDATGKTVTLNGAIKWGARSPVYSAKADGTKISSADFAAMNFDISGV